MELKEIMEPDDWVDFWDSTTTKDCFFRRGYQLYDRRYYDKGLYDEGLSPTIPSEEVSASVLAYPFAYHNEHKEDNESLNIYSAFAGPVYFAQDGEARHFVIKFIRPNTSEYRILEFLRDIEPSTVQQGCIIPILELLQFGDYWFSVMPRWEMVKPRGQLRTLEHTLDLMHSMLKAVKFLHDHNIFHRDIKITNVVSNFSYDRMTLRATDIPLYWDILNQKRLLYAMIDFDLSVIFPANAQKEQCRLPYEESFYGTYMVEDLAQGDFDFDPFAYDVGVLGVVFATQFGSQSHLAPMLAPLIDKMVTHEIQNRFTAAQALQFFEKMKNQLSEAQLSSPVDLAKVEYVYENDDRWKGLPEDFVKKWGHYKVPPLPLSVKILRRLCRSHPHVHGTIAFFRKWCHFVVVRPIYWLFTAR